jgi:hypothetical protein
MDDTEGRTVATVHTAARAYFTEMALLSSIDDEHDVIRRVLDGPGRRLRAALATSIQQHLRLTTAIGVTDG